MRRKPRHAAHRITTAHLQAAYPFMSEGGLGSDGVYIGRDVFGGSFVFDPWALYGREITGPNMLVIGQIGYAKSSLVKCLDEATEVIDPRTGVPRSIGEVCKDPEVTSVLTLDDRRRIVDAPITAKVDAGLSPCLRVTFASGRSVTTTPEHPFLMPDGWRRADSVAVGETAAVPARLPFPDEPVRIQDEEVDVLAALLSEGCHLPCQTGGAGFTSADPEVIPESVYRLPPDQLARFLAVFWMGDGSVGVSGVTVTLAPERTVRQLQHLLLRFGIQSRVRSHPTAHDGKPLAAWDLRVHPHCEQAFLDAIPLWGRKRQRLATMCAARRRPPQSDVGAPSVSPGSRDEPDGWLPDSDIFWDRITSVEDVGERHVFDLTVEPTACFVAGDVIVHNTYVWRQMLFGRTAWVVDPKGEYETLAALCGTEPIRFRSGGSLRLNPLDPMIGGTAQLALLRSISGVMLGRSLRPEEDAALERAHDEAVFRAAERGGQATVPEVVYRLLDPSEGSAAELRTTTVRLAEDGRQLALALRRMGAGDLRGMFDGPTSPGLNLSGRLVVFNLREVADEARPILMACTAAWLQGSWAREDGVRRIVVLDEAWVVLRHLAIARWLRESWKLARQFGVQNIAVMHRLSDLTAAGDAGSEQVQLAKGLLEDSETRVIYRQSPGEVEAARELLGLTQTEVDQIPMLERGEALWRVGRRSFIVQHRLDPLLERELVDTDHNMVAQGGPWVARTPEPAVAGMAGAEPGPAGVAGSEPGPARPAAPEAGPAGGDGSGRRAVRAAAGDATGPGQPGGAGAAGPGQPAGAGAGRNAAGLALPGEQAPSTLAAMPSQNGAPSTNGERPR